MLQVLKSEKPDDNAFAQVKWARNLNYGGFCLKGENPLSFSCNSIFFKKKSFEEGQTFNTQFSDTEGKWKLT